MLYNNRLILRDLRQEDIDTLIHWETVETEWKLWNGPWEHENISADEKEEQLKKAVKKFTKIARKKRKAEEIRHDFQIVLNDKEKSLIGRCNSYKIAEDYMIDDENGSWRAVGISLPNQSFRNKGYGALALTMFIDYLLAHGEKSIYTQTWSGNTRMIALAQKLGFVECCRKVNLRKVRGELYDGLSFRLDLEKFYLFKKEILKTGA